MFTLTINCSVLYQIKNYLILLKKLCKVNKGKFGKIIINVIDNCKMVLLKGTIFFVKLGPIKRDGGSSW
jgi:hypothetical protein